MPSSLLSKDENSGTLDRGSMGRRVRSGRSQVMVGGGFPSALQISASARGMPTTPVTSLGTSTNSGGPVTNKTTMVVMRRRVRRVILTMASHQSLLATTISMDRELIVPVVSITVHVYRSAVALSAELRDNKRPLVI